MSECARAVGLIEDGVHGRLDDDEARFLSGHVESCTACGPAYRRVDRQRAVVAGFVHRPVAPPDLRVAVSRPLSRPQRRWAFLRSAFVGAIAATVLIALAFMSGLVSWRPSAFERLAREAIEDHIRVVLRYQSGARGPTDAGEILAAMQPVLDYSVPRPAPGTDQLRLSGGRPSYLYGQPVACFYTAAPARMHHSSWCRWRGCATPPLASRPSPKYRSGQHIGSRTGDEARTPTSWSPKRRRTW